MELPINSSARIAVTFSSDTRITSLSPGIESITGYSSCEMVGRPITQFFADRTVFQMPYILDTVKEEGRWEGEIAYRDRNQNAVKAHGILIPLADCKTRNSGYVLLSKSAASRDSGDDSGAALADAGNRIRSLVHDLNNPLAFIMGSTQLLALNARCTGKVRSDIEKLYAELEKMAHVVEKLHGYALSLCERDYNPACENNSIRNSA